MTPENLIYFALAIAGAVGAVYWRFSAVITDVRDDVSTVRSQLADHKLHTAETYVTKAGMQEQTSAIMKAIDSVGDKIDRTNERLDRVFEHQQPPRPTRRQG
ncbi:hypothetical protein EN816_00910 [Mesorhizobium sp. M8A.F.Ca.ET.173.01.1.1]|nr:hypothetical protein EN816_00910 [Mesorhizobium sp. M8A.F.Ca.ET.173.01.1.1]